MDISTHALASLVLARGFFPRRRWPVFLGMLLAGTLADIDLLSAIFGPAAYFDVRRIFAHSLPGLLAVVAIAMVFTRYLGRKQPDPITSLVAPLSLAAALHAALDLLQSDGIALLWPVRSTRFAADWVPPIDPWILVFLVLGIFLPELFRLITSEIGVKDKSPRGRNGAVTALVLLLVYILGRAALHNGAVIALDPHSYAGESARRVAAYPDSLSLFTWHGVVETQSLLCLADVPAGFGRPFDAESAECLHKPQDSPELAAAQQADVAEAYVRAVPFPRAAVAKSPDGSEVELRSMRDLAEHETTRRIGARITLDAHFRIVNEEFVWLKDLRLR